MFTPIPDRLSELVARDWTLRSVCLHHCVGEMEEEVGGEGDCARASCFRLRASGRRSGHAPAGGWRGGVKGRSNGIISEEMRKQHLTHISKGEEPRRKEEAEL